MGTVRFMGLKAERARLGVTQKWAAERLGISAVAYGQKENGIRPFTHWEIEKLLFLFNKGYEEMFGRDMWKGGLRRVYN